MTNAPETRPVDHDAVADLRAMLESRGMVAPASFDAIVARSAIADVDALLARLGVAGHLTAMQVEALRTAFRSEQSQKLFVMLQNAVQRGMLSPPHAEAAQASFQAVLTRQGPAQFLVSSQYLTAHQAAWLSDPGGVQFAGVPPQPYSNHSYAYAPVEGAPQSFPIHHSGFGAPVAAPPWPGTTTSHSAHRPLFPTEADTWFPLMIGPGGMLLVFVFLGLLMNTSLGSWSAWWILPFLVAPVATLLWQLSDRPRGERLKWVILTLAMLPVAAVALAVYGWVHPPAEPVVALSPDCTMTANGQGQCVFTNVRSHPGEGCGSVTATCTSTTGVRNSRDSETICSGLVGSGRTRRMSFSVAEFDRIRGGAVPYGADWRDHCRFTWSPQ